MLEPKPHKQGQRKGRLAGAMVPHPIPEKKKKIDFQIFYFFILVTPSPI
jgi:hypothetical protein